MSELFTSVRGPLSTTVSGSTLNVEGGSSLRRASSMRRTHQNAMASLKRKSVCMQAKFQVVGKKFPFMQTRNIGYMWVNVMLSKCNWLPKHEHYNFL